ncbi:hypothetical protein [Tunturiibacter gelidiferens]|uniref:hypothetical protein n=1 Tax=Tunturiibacter gelidiferens TaxID=3069689 RepID=UPI003D9ADA06
MSTTADPLQYDNQRGNNNGKSKNKCGVSPLRRAMKLRDFGRDDDSWGIDGRLLGRTGNSNGNGNCNSNGNCNDNGNCNCNCNCNDNDNDNDNDNCNSNSNSKGEIRGLSTTSRDETARLRSR